jgi:hypothetical protein
MSKIIRKTNREKEKFLLDEFLNQLQNEQAVEEAQPLEITQPVKERMVHLMEIFLANKEKLRKLGAIKREITTHSNVTIKDLTTLMKLYGLTELIKGKHKFSLEQTSRKTSLIAKNKQAEFKEFMNLLDPAKVDKACELMEKTTKEITMEKLQCLDYNGV